MGSSEPHDKPPPGLVRIARGEWQQFKPERIRAVRTPAIYWTGRSFAPTWITGWCRHYGAWFVRLRTRRDIWRDREDWYVYTPGRLIPLDIDERDRQDWLPKRPET